jgi:hypothetical protein
VTYARVRDVLIAVIWCDKQDMCLLTNSINHKQKVTSFIYAGELINLPLLTLAIVRKRTMLTKWTEWLITIQLITEHAGAQKLFLCPLDITIVNKHIILTPCSSQMTTSNFK